MRQLLRYAPLFALHVACSVYDESLVGGGSSSVGGTSGSGSSSNGGSGGISSGGGGITGGSGSSDTGGMAGSGGSDSGGSGGKDPGDGGTGSGGSGSSGGGTGATGGATGGDGSGGGSGGTPTDPALIEDFEDRNNKIKLNGGGYWFTAAAEEDCITPKNVPSGNVRPVALSPARGESTYAMHFVGVGCTGWGAQGGFGLRATEGMPFDASQYSGIKFWAKLGSASSSDFLGVEFATSDTHPKGGTCDDPGATTGVHTPDDPDDDCYGHYGAGVVITTSWDEYEIPFDEDLQKAPGGGPALIDQSALVQILFSWKLGEDFDVWIDDIRFY